MKVSVKKIIVVLILFMGSLSMTAYVGTTPKLKFKKDAPNTVVLKVSALSNAIQVVLQNSEGGLLFTETLAKGYTYRKMYDLSDFSDGVYYVKVVEATDVKFFKIEKGSKNNITGIDKLPFE